MRFSILQLFTFAVLVALLAGLVAAAREHGGSQRFTDLQFTHDGRFLTGLQGDVVYVWQRRGETYERLFGTKRLNYVTRMPPRVTRDPDGRPGIVFVFYDSSGRRFYLERHLLPLSNSPLNRHEILGYPDDFSASADGQRFAIRINGSIEVRRWDSEDPLRTFAVATDWRSHTRLSPSGDRLLHVETDRMRLWDVDSGKLMADRKLPDDRTWSPQVAFSPNDRFVDVRGLPVWLWGQRPARLQIWDATTLEPREDLSPDLLSILPPSTRRNAIKIEPIVWINDGKATRLITVHQNDGSLKLFVTDLLTGESRTLSAPSTLQVHSEKSVALSPDQRFCAVAQQGRVDLFDLTRGTRRTIEHPRPLVFSIIYSLAFIALAVVGGKMSQHSMQRNHFAQRETILPPSAITGGLGVLSEGCVSLTLGLIVLVTSVSLLVLFFGWTPAVLILLATTPGVLYVAFRGRFIVLEETASRETAEEIDPQLTEPATDPLRVPTTIVAVWIASSIGGVLAIVLPVVWMLHSGFVTYPFWYYSVLVGVLAVSQAASCSFHRLTLTACLQMGCLLACDVVNFLIGCGVLILLQRADVREFRRSLDRRRQAGDE